MDLLGGYDEGGVRITWHADHDNKVVVQRSQDVEPVLDMVAAVNAEGVRSTDGIGRPVVEMPIALAIAWCDERGIPWEKFLYTRDYDAEWLRFATEHKRLAYAAPRTYR